MSKKQDGGDGPSVDLGFQVDILASLKAGFAGLQDGARTRRQDEEARIPLDYTIRGGGAAPAAGILIFSCDGPPLGRAWVLRRLAIGGTTPTAAAAGAAYFFASSAGDPDQLITSTWFDYTSALPAVGWYTSRQVVVQNGQRLWVLVTNPTPGQTYALSGAALSEISNERAAARYTL